MSVRRLAQGIPHFPPAHFALAETRHMDAGQFPQLVEQGLTWIGFGVVCGTAAKLLLPGRDPSGTLTTWLLGSGGSLIGAACYAYFTGDRLQSLISPVGFGVAIGGALVLLVSHRLLGGRWRGSPDRHIVEQVVVPAPHLARRRRSVRTTDLD